MTAMTMHPGTMMVINHAFHGFNNSSCITVGYFSCSLPKYKVQSCTNCSLSISFFISTRKITFVVTAMDQIVTGSIHLSIKCLSGPQVSNSLITTGYLIAMVMVICVSMLSWCGSPGYTITNVPDQIVYQLTSITNIVYKSSNNFLMMT